MLINDKTHLQHEGVVVAELQCRLVDVAGPRDVAPPQLDPRQADVRTAVVRVDLNACTATQAHAVHTQVRNASGHCHESCRCGTPRRIVDWSVIPVTKLVFEH